MSACRFLTALDLCLNALGLARCCLSSPGIAALDLSAQLLPTAKLATGPPELDLLASLLVSKLPKSGFRCVMLCWESRVLPRCPGFVLSLSGQDTGVMELRAVSLQPLCT